MPGRSRDRSSTVVHDGGGAIQTPEDCPPSETFRALVALATVAPWPRMTSTATLDGGLTLSYAEQGERSRQALVLLPGPTDSWRSYEPVLARLPSSVRAVAVSQRGHGDSDKPMTGYRVEDFAADVVPFLDVLGIDRAVLAGHSGSCPVVRRVAIDQPERVAGLVLEASPTTLHGDPRLEEFVDDRRVGPGGPDRGGLRPLLRRRHVVGGARPQGPRPARGRAAQGPGSRVEGDVRPTPAATTTPPSWGTSPHRRCWSGATPMRSWDATSRTLLAERIPDTTISK